MGKMEKIEKDILTDEEMLFYSVNENIKKAPDTIGEHHLNEAPGMDAGDIESPFEYLPAGLKDEVNKMSAGIIERYWQRSLAKQICNYVPMIGPTGKIFVSTKNAQGDRKIVSASGQYELNTIISRVTPEFLIDAYNINKKVGISMVSKMLTQDMLETLDEIVVQRIKSWASTDSLTFSTDNSISDYLKLKDLGIKIDNIIMQMGLQTKRGYRTNILVTPKVAAALLAIKKIHQTNIYDDTDRDIIGYYNGMHTVIIDTNDYMNMTGAEGALIMHDGDFVGDRPMVIGMYSNNVYFNSDYSITEYSLMIRNRQLFLRNPIDTEIFGNTATGDSVMAKMLSVDFTNISVI